MKKVIASVIILFLTAEIFAQVSVEASVNKNKVAQSERFQLTLAINNGGTIKEFKPPAMSDFIILGGPNQSSSTMIVNNQVNRTISYSYVLQPKNIGKFIIGSAYVKVDDKTYTTQPISIDVYDKPATNSGSQDQAQTNSDDDVYDYIRQNAFIKTEISDNEIYEGENITVTLKFYVNRNSSIYDYRILQAVKVPKYDGFYVEDIELKEKQAQTESISGQQYSVTTIKKTILTPQKSGALEIDPITLDVVFGVKLKKTKNKSGDPMQDLMDEFFNNPFGGNVKEVRYPISSSTQRIKVNELPANAPADFNGAVGKFIMKTEINATATKTDEPLTYRVIISGNGNLNLFNPPQLTLPPGWETYDPKTSEAGGAKTFEYLLIPRSPGDFTVPAYTWTYFDPEKKQYQTLTSEPYNVKVEAGPGYNPSAGNYAVNKEDVEMLAQDIRFIKKNEPNYVNDAFDLFGTGIFYSLLGIPFIAGFGLFIFTSKRKKLMSNEVALKYNRANAAARKRLVKAKTFMTTNNARSFYDETIKALWGYLSDKLNIPQTELTKENIHDLLIKHDAAASTAEETLALLDQCEMALFAPQLLSTSLEVVYKNALALITKLENELK
ncbi:MAG: BatD family protein [Chitinophagales bacterium]